MSAVEKAKYPVMMKEFCRLCDISKNRLLRALQDGVIDVGYWVEHNKQQVRYFTMDDVIKTRIYFDGNWGKVTLSPRGEMVQNDPRWKSLEEAAALAGVHSRTIVENEKRGDLPPPKWLRKPFPKRVYGMSDVRRIVAVLKGESKAVQWALTLAADDLPTVPDDDIDDGEELTFNK